MTEFITVPLERFHERSGFDCGSQPLNNYLRFQAGQDQRRKLTVCFVMADTEQRILGYYTLSNAGVEKAELPETLLKKFSKSYSRLPVTLLGRLAVDLSQKGKGFGELLLIDALKRCFLVSGSQIGSIAVVVDPLDASASVFYQKYGFIKLPDSNRMFLPMKTISSLF